MAGIPDCLFPLRLPDDKVVDAYASVKEAFAAGDYCYVTRFGSGHAELHGLALLMMGNRIGGERILERFNIRTARAFLYRAFAAWRDDKPDQAQRWIDECKRIGGEETSLARLEDLMARDSFRVVLHSDFTPLRFLERYKSVKGVEFIVTRYLLQDDEGALPIGQPLAAAVPPGPPVDLVIVDDGKMIPSGATQLGAPVVVNIHDHEWYYDTLDQSMPMVDLISAHVTHDHVEVGRPFNRPANIFCQMLPLWAPKAKGLAQRFAETADRSIDILFTGGITSETYFDKRQRVLPLTAIDNKYKVFIYEGILPMEQYEGVMKATRFVMNSVRFSSGWFTRCIDAISQGSLCLMERGGGSQFLFSEYFDCFQYYSDATLLEDVERLLADYDTLIQKVIPQAARLEAEICDLFPEDEDLRIRRYIKNLMFVTRVLRADAPLAGSKLPDGEPPLCTSSPEVFAPYQKQLARLIATITPQGPGRAGDWLRLAAAQAVTAGMGMGTIHQTIGNGLQHHPDSLALWYSYAQTLNLLNAKDDANRYFRSLLDHELVLANDDPFPRFIDRQNCFYWVADARIRQRAADCVSPFVAERDVWHGFALAHAADITLEQGLAAAEPQALLVDAATTAERSLALFPHTELARRSYLRAAFNLAARGDAQYRNLFLSSFAAASKTDYTIFHDFSAAAVQFLLEQGRRDEAVGVIFRLHLFVGRAQIFPQFLIRYPEILPLFETHNLPTGWKAR
jgi:hypothetical protein